jgi:hypothetical protein
VDWCLFDTRLKGATCNVADAVWANASLGVPGKDETSSPGNRKVIDRSSVLRPVLPGFVVGGGDAWDELVAAAHVHLAEEVVDVHLRNLRTTSTLVDIVEMLS